MATERAPRPQLTDEQLARIGLKRERWEAIQAELARREARAPSAGDPAPDFELPTLESRDRTVRLSEFFGTRPVALIFGSYT
jgi:hypothetical protein